MGSLQDIIVEPVGIVVAQIVPQSLPDRHLGIAPGQEAALVEDSAATDREPDNNRRAVLGEQFLGVFVVPLRERGKQSAFERAGAILVDLGDRLVRFHDDADDIVGLAALVLAHDLNSVPFDRNHAVLTEQRDPAPRFLGPRFGVGTKRVALAGTAKDHRRRPHFVNQDLVIILAPILGRSKVEMGFEPGDVVLVGVAEQKPVDIKASLAVSIQPFAQISHHVGRVVIIIVGSLAHVEVDQKLLIIIQRY